MFLTIEVDRESDGRWIAEVSELPGALAYGKSRQEALISGAALALRLLADRLEHGEEKLVHSGISFEATDKPVMASSASVTPSLAPDNKTSLVMRTQWIVCWHISTAAR